MTPEQIDKYWKEGVVFPFTAFDEEYAGSLIPEFFALQERMSSWTSSKQLLKTNLVSTWVYQICCNARILDEVECILGPNLMVWGATFFAKQPGHGLHVGWHQDLRYWGLQPPDGVLTVWLGLTDASVQNGAMQIIRGSHLGPMRHHSNSYDENNMLMSDQSIELTSEDLGDRQTVELKAGQFSLHHSMIIHGSGPNNSDGPRIGLSLNYISVDVIQLKNRGHDSAMLVRGVDYFNNFEKELAPKSDFSPESIKQFRKSIVLPCGLATVEGKTDSIINFENII